MGKTGGGGRGGRAGAAGMTIPAGWGASDYFAVPNIERTEGDTTVRIRQSGTMWVVGAYRDGYRGELRYVDFDEAVARGNLILEEGLGAMIV